MYNVAGGQTKEEVMETNERLRAVRVRLEESYDTAKRALVTLMAKYTESKQTRNVFQRYNVLKAMIKVCFYHLHDSGQHKNKDDNRDCAGFGKVF